MARPTASIGVQKGRGGGGDTCEVVARHPYRKAKLGALIREDIRHLAMTLRESTTPPRLGMGGYKVWDLTRRVHGPELWRRRRRMRRRKEEGGRREEDGIRKETGGWIKEGDGGRRREKEG